MSLYERIEAYAKTNYIKIDPDEFILGDLLYNHRCHLNSVQKVKQNLADDVYLCLTLNKDEVFIHFINGIIIDGITKYQDNTLGWTYEKFDYYIIKKIKSSEYKDVNKILYDTKDSLINQHITLWEKYITFRKIKDII